MRQTHNNAHDSNKAEAMELLEYTTDCSPRQAAPEHEQMMYSPQSRKFHNSLRRLARVESEANCLTVYAALGVALLTGSISEPGSFIVATPSITTVPSGFVAMVESFATCFGNRAVIVTTTVTLSLMNTGA